MDEGQSWDEVFIQTEHPWAGEEIGHPINALLAVAPIASSLSEYFLLRKTQKQAIRIITGSLWNAHTDPLFAMQNIMKISEIQKMQVPYFMFKVHRNQLPAYFLDMFNTNSVIHSYNTRRANDTTLCTTELAYYTHQFALLDHYYGTR